MANLVLGYLDEAYRCADRDAKASMRKALPGRFPEPEQQPDMNQWQGANSTELAEAIDIITEICNANLGPVESEAIRTAVESARGRFKYQVGGNPKSFREELADLMDRHGAYLRVEKGGISCIGLGGILLNLKSDIETSLFVITPEMLRRKDEEK